MSRKKRAPEPEPEEVDDMLDGSPMAGACVLIVLAVGALAVVYAVSPDAAIFTTWAAGMFAMWRVARHRMSDMRVAPPPLPSERPSCSECAGHELISVTPLGGQKGMLIYKTAPADRPNHTHVHLRRTP